MSPPIRESTSANATSPWIERRPTPVTRTGPPATTPAARKYDAAEASPSTWIVPGLAYRAVAGIRNDDQPSCAISTPKRASRLG